MGRLKFRLEFDGAAFCGWQLQAEDQESLGPSIQGTIERALSVVLRRREERFVVQGCGRTDAGVHAAEFFFHVDVADELVAEIGGLERLRHGLNSVLPDSVSITHAEVKPGFHALEDITTKTYEYRLLLRRAKPALERGRCHWLPVDPAGDAFDVERFAAALKMFEGEHDFVAFAASNSSAKTSVRRIVRTALLREAGPDELRLRVRFEGTGFLKQMVRNLVGTLIEVGQGRRDPATIPALLGTGFPAGPGRRIDAGACAPAEGLFLWSVSYGDDVR